VGQAMFRLEQEPSFVVIGIRLVSGTRFGRR
jgi:hypothetical protein